MGHPRGGSGVKRAGSRLSPEGTSEREEVAGAPVRQAIEDLRGLGSRLFSGQLVTYSRHISAVPFPCLPLLVSPRATEEISPS